MTAAGPRTATFPLGLRPQAVPVSALAIRHRRRSALAAARAGLRAFSLALRQSALPRLAVQRLTEPRSVRMSGTWGGPIAADRPTTPQPPHGRA